jgi:hypothetical protein
VGGVAQGADHRPLLLGRLPGQLMSLGRVVQAVSEPAFAPFSDGLGADAIALGQHARGVEEWAISARTAGLVRAFGRIWCMAHLLPAQRAASATCGIYTSQPSRFQRWSATRHLDTELLPETLQKFHIKIPQYNPRWYT